MTSDAASAAGWRRHLVDTRFGQLHVRAHGAAAAGRPLVLLHMSPRSSRMWAHVQPRLARPTYALDRLGYGCSDAPPRALTLAEYARSALDALDALGIAEFDVLGMHTGSLEAVELAHQVPARVGRCGIVAVPVFDAAERAHGLATFAAQRVVPSEDGAHVAEAWRARFAYRQPPYDLADVQTRFVDYLLAPVPGAAYDAVFRYDYAERLRTCPVPLVAFAPRDDLYEYTVRARPLLPAGARYVDLPDLDLDLFLRAPERMAALLGEHL